MTVTGRTTRWRATEYSRGQMVDATKESILMTKKREEEPSFGLMEESMRATGRMANSMELESTPLPQEKLKEESGMKAKGLHGLIDVNNFYRLTKIK